MGINCQKCVHRTSCDLLTRSGYNTCVGALFDCAEYREDEKQQLPEEFYLGCRCSDDVNSVSLKNELKYDYYIDLDRLLGHNSYLAKVVVTYKGISYKVDVDRVVATLMFNNCLEVVDD